MTRLEPTSFSLRVGPIEARIRPTEVASFAEAVSIGGDMNDNGAIPATFPIAWLSHPSVANALRAGLAHEGRLPVLEAQRFAYSGQLAVGETYLFEVEQSINPDDPIRFTVTASVRAKSGALIVHFKATYRLMKLAGA